VVGIDDAPFKPHTRSRVLLIGAVLRGGQWLDGVLSTSVSVDGRDATWRIIKMVNESRHKGQLRVIMTDGATFAGFNVVDIREIFERTGIPVIAVSKDRPNMKKIERAIKNLPDWQARWKILKRAGKIYSVESRSGAHIFMQMAGVKKNDAEKIIKTTATRSFLPEPLRVAHLIARGVGENVKSQNLA
jgi:endonuclease V-like protein UPF0215 family